MINGTETNNLIKDLVSTWTCQFKSNADEDRYLTKKLKQDKTISVFLTRVIAVILTLVIYLDHMVIQAHFWPYPALILRFALVFICMAASFLIPHIKTTRQFRVFTWSFVLLFLSNLQIMVLTYQDDYILHVFFDVIILIALYFSTLFSFKASCLLGISYALVGSSIVISFKTIETHAIAMVLIAYLAANIIGIIISAQEHLLKRRLYIRSMALNNLAAELQSQALKDALTHIPNRRAFYENYPSYQKTAARLASSPEKVCIVVADIDFFKQVNDTYGHDVGDSVLIQFSALLNNAIRPFDGVFRFGGEEFLIVLVGCTKSNAAKKINKIIKELNETIFDIQEIKHPITASFGLTILKIDDTERSVVTRADKALYQAKQQGKNQLQISEQDE